MTPIEITARIREAWDTLRRVPAHTVPGYRCGWPDVVRDYFEAYGETAPSVRLEPASPRAIDRMHETFGWFRFVGDRDLTRALWLTCGCGMGPRRAGIVMGIDRLTVKRLRDAALTKITEGLSCNKSSRKPENARIIGNGKLSITQHTARVM